MTLPLPITAVYAGLLAVLAVMLALVVMKLRTSLRVGLGDGGEVGRRFAMTT